MRDLLREPGGRPTLTEQIALGFENQLGRAPVLGDTLFEALAEAAHDHDREATRLATREVGRPGDLIRDGDERRLQLAAATVDRAAQVDQRGHARDADRDIGGAVAKRTAERVGDDHADVFGGELAKAAANPPGALVGVDR